MNHLKKFVSVFGFGVIASELLLGSAHISTGLPAGDPPPFGHMGRELVNTHALAKQAGDLSVRGFLNDYYATPAHWTIKASAQRVMRALNAWCHGMTRQMEDGSYVSSLSTVVFKDRGAHLFHVGDTLVFRLRGAEFEQLSRDHVTDLGGYRYPSRALGMDVSLDGGQTWKHVNDTNAYVARFAPEGRILWLAGKDRIHRVDWDNLTSEL